MIRIRTAIKQSDWRWCWKRPDYTPAIMFEVMRTVFNLRGGFRSVVSEVSDRVYLDRKMGSGLSPTTTRRG